MLIHRSKTVLSVLAADLLGTVLLGTVLLGTACGGGPRAVRGSDVAGLDDEAMGTGLDRRDLKLMLHENMESLQSSALVKRWQGENRPAVAVLSMRNDTSEHIDGVLQALITEVEKQQSDAFDASTVSRLGSQVGVRYFVTGRVYSADERQSGERRVQYFLFMRVLDVETGDILWQNSAAVTKAIVK